MNNKELKAEPEAQQSENAELLPSAPLVANPLLPAVLSIKISDLISHGYKKKGSVNGTWLFEKKEKVGQPLHLIYNVKEQWMRLRYPRSVGFYSVIIAKIKISSKVELDFVFDKINHNDL